MKLLRGITWNHPRGYSPIYKASEEFCKTHLDIKIEWDIRSLKDFGDYPIEPLAEKYDFIMLDHPFMGTAVEKNILIPLDEWVTKEYLEDQRLNSVGKSCESYSLEGHQWAFAVDAAAQVSTYRKDLFEKLDLSVPKTWEEVFDLAKSLPENYKIGFPLVPTDAYCSFMSLCAGIGGNEFFNQLTGINPLIAEEALELLQKLVPYLHSKSLQMNPIEMLDEMSNNDEIVYVPLIFGYSNYSRPENRGRLLTFTNIPSFKNEPAGGLLGGVGLAVSAFSRHKQDAVDFATFVASGEFQRTDYFESGGQPGHRSAWIDSETNNRSNQFFKNTLKTLDLCYLRPRYAGYNVFQEKAGDIIHDFLLTNGNVSEVIKRLDLLFHSTRK